MTSSSYKRGDVVLVRFPQSDLIHFKHRPALVVQDENVPTGMDDRIIVQITSNTDRTGPSRIRVDKNTSEGSTMSLLSDSIIRADKIATVRHHAIDRTIGNCPIMDKVDNALKIILGL